MTTRRGWMAALGLSIGLGGIASPAGAQTRHVGVKAGPSFSMLAFEPDDSGGYDRRIAADGGGFAVLPVATGIAAQIEALFTSRGAELYDPDMTLTGAILLQYLDIPVLLRVQGPARGALALHVVGGPYAGVRLSAKRQVSAVVSSIRTGEKVDISNEIERFEFGWTIGAGVDVGRRMVIDGRYSRGLSAFNTDKTDGFRIRNRAITVMAGVRF